MLMAMLHSLIARRRFGPQTQWWPLCKTLTSGLGLEDLFYVLPCVILFLCFSVLLVLRLPALGEERANLSAFRTFVRFVLVWTHRFPLLLGVWEGLRFVIVALSGLFSYIFGSRFIWNVKPYFLRKLIKHNVVYLNFDIRFKRQIVAKHLNMAGSEYVCSFSFTSNFLLFFLLWYLNDFSCEKTTIFFYYFCQKDFIWFCII